MSTTTMDRDGAGSGRRWRSVASDPLALALLALAAGAAVTVASALQLHARDVLAGDPRGFMELVSRQGLAALGWLMAAPGVVWLARRAPFGARAAAVTVAIHALGVVTVAAFINLVIPALWALAGIPTGAGYLDVALGGFVGLLHVNALVYLVLSGSTQLLDRASGRGAASGSARPLGRIAIPGERGVSVVDVEEIRWIEAAGDYVRLHLAGGSRLLSERMWSLERDLDETRFVRVHRSAIVRVDALKEVRSLASGDAIAVLEDGAEVRVSRRRRKRLLDRL